MGEAVKKADDAGASRPTTWDFEMRYSAGTYLKRNLSIVSGDGVHVFDKNGGSYIDCIAGIGTAILGHNNESLVDAITAQAEQIISVPELLCNPTRALYQKRILEHLPVGFSRVFLCNSGTESIEGALKFARFTTGRPGMVALKKGYHGKTLGSLSVTSDEKYRTPFEPLLPEAYFVMPRKIDELRELFQAHGDRIGAFLFEAVQGEGGVHPQDQEFLSAAVACAREYGALVIADEVQTGFGRTGKMWGFEHYDVEPDLVCMAKAMAGGLPMGGIGLGRRVAELPPAAHSSTFGGNPLCAAAAHVVLDAIEEQGLIEHAAAVGQRLMESIESAGLKPVREVRGKGLMIGIELKEKAKTYVEQCQERGLLVLLAGPRVIRLLPPLIISESEAEEVAAVLISVLSD